MKRLRQKCMRMCGPVVLIALGLCVGTTMVRADGFRCRSGRLISDGARIEVVRSKCGPPDTHYQRVEPRGRGSWVTVDEWSYELGRMEFVRYLRFENGRLMTVTLGEHGTKD